MKPCWHGSVETLLPLLSLSPRLQEPTERWSRSSALTVTSVGLNTSISARKAGRSQYLQPFKTNANRVVLQFQNYSANGGSCAMLCNTTLPKVLLVAVIAFVIWVGAFPSIVSFWLKQIRSWVLASEEIIIMNVIRRWLLPSKPVVLKSGVDVLKRHFWNHSALQWRLKCSSGYEFPLKTTFPFDATLLLHSVVKCCFGVVGLCSCILELYTKRLVTLIIK